MILIQKKHELSCTLHGSCPIFQTMSTGNIHTPLKSDSRLLPKRSVTFILLCHCQANFTVQISVFCLGRYQCSQPLRRNVFTFCFCPRLLLSGCIFQLLLWVQQIRFTYFLCDLCAWYICIASMFTPQQLSTGHYTEFTSVVSFNC